MNKFLLLPSLLFFVGILEASTYLNEWNLEENTNGIGSVEAGQDEDRNVKDDREQEQDSKSYEDLEYLKALLKKLDAAKAHRVSSSKSFARPIKQHPSLKEKTGRSFRQSRKWHNSPFAQDKDCDESVESKGSNSIENVNEGAIETFHLKCRCGQRLASKPVGRIFGGSDAKKHEFPWRCVLLNSKSTPFCSASVITHEYLLTAAHCFKNPEQRNNFRVLCRLHDHTDGDEIGSRVEATVSKIIEHPEWNELTYENDIALLKLETALAFSDELHPVCLPWNMRESSMGELTATASGWGKTHANGGMSKILKKVTLQTISSENCQEYNENRGKFFVTENNFCTINPGVGPCSGDSGGSLDYKNPETGKYVNIGLVSWAIGCAKAESPTVFTNVAKYLDWISIAAEGEAFCKS